MDGNISSRPNLKQAVPFFMVVNMESSLRFYIDGLDFALKIKWEPKGKIEWCWLELDGVAVMLQEYKVNIPAIQRGEGVSICFMCNDALAIYRKIVSRGLSTVMEPFVGNTLWVVELRDPDGYSIYFESPAEELEGTLYSERNDLSFT